MIFDKMKIDIEPKINILKEFGSVEIQNLISVIESMMEDIYKRGYEQCNKDNNYSSVNRQF